MTEGIFGIRDEENLELFHSLPSSKVQMMQYMPSRKEIKLALFFTDYMKA